MIKGLEYFCQIEQIYMPEINVGSIKLTQGEADWLQVITNMSNEAYRVRVGIIVKGHLQRFGRKYINDVDYYARRYDLTWEQAFVLLLFREQPKNGPFPEDDIAWAKQQNPLLNKEEALAALITPASSVKGTEMEKLDKENSNDTSNPGNSK